MGDYRSIKRDLIRQFNEHTKAEIEAMVRNSTRPWRDAIARGDFRGKPVDGDIGAGGTVF